MSDRDLFAAIARGDKQALSAFYIRYVDGVRHIALRVVHDEDDAHDVAQDVFIALPSVAARYRGEAEPKTLLHRVAVNIASSYATRRHRRTVVHAASGYEPLPAPDDPHRVVAARDAVRRLRVAYDELHPHYREALDLAAQGFDAATVSRRLGISRVAARLRLHHARRALTSHLASPRYQPRGVFIQKLSS